MFGSNKIDLSAEAKEVKKEMGIGVMPDELWGKPFQGCWKQPMIWIQLA